VKYIDSLTYRQYLDGDYRSLIETSNIARNEGISFYYLNYRTAIAYYLLKDYAKAATFYKATLSEKPDDQQLIESLYYAYLLSGQKENAAILAGTMAPHTQAIVGYNPSVMDQISLSGGYLMNDNKPDIHRAAGFDSLNQYQNMVFSALGIGFRLSERTKLKLGYQLYNTRFQRSAGTTLIMEDDLTQHQLVAALEFFSPSNITWGFAGGYYNIEKAGKHPDYGNRFRWTGHRRGQWLHHFNRRENVSLVAACLSQQTVYLYPPGDCRGIFELRGDRAIPGKRLAHILPAGKPQLLRDQCGCPYLHPQRMDYRTIHPLPAFGGETVRTRVARRECQYRKPSELYLRTFFLVYDTYDPIKALAGISLSCYLKRMTVSTGYQWQQKEGYAFSATGYTPTNTIITL